MLNNKIKLLSCDKLKIKSIRLFHYILIPENSKYLPLVISGLLSSLAFAPIFIFPLLIYGISTLLYYINNSKTGYESFFNGWLFGVAHFFSGTYWITISIKVYIDQFWWVIPFAIILVPSILAIGIGLVGLLTFKIKNKYNDIFNNFNFAAVWTLIEWLRSWILTGFPWNLAGYSLCFDTRLIQLSNIFGIYGLSFIVIFLSGNFWHLFEKKYYSWFKHCLISLIVITSVLCYGCFRLENNPLKMTDIKVRLVQPSIKQKSLWMSNELYHNIYLHKQLSKHENGVANFNPDIVVWSESAVTVPLVWPHVEDILRSSIDENSILVTGGISEVIDHNIVMQNRPKANLYSSMYAINKQGSILFDYYKQHLVPFGEYMPFGKYLGLKKLTSGYLDYTPGKNNQICTLFIKNHKINIRPLICYEAIFPEEARIKNKNIDLFINITNDTWFGNSTGPYQHFEITRMRAIENGIPIVRVGNNGISAIIDSYGRILHSTKLDDFNVLDGYIPQKSRFTMFAKYGNSLTILLVILIYFNIFFIKLINKRHSCGR